MAKSIYEILVQIEGNEKAQQALNDIGRAAGLSGAALTAFSGAAAKSAAAYETSLAAVSTVATEATGTTAEFDAALNGLATEMNGAISISDAAKASYDILSSGYSNQADVLTILREAQKTAVGGFSDLGTISDATTTVMNAFGDSLGATLDTTQRVQMITNGMIATQNLGKITAGEYASQIGNVASTSAAAGVSLNEVNAAISVATADGIQVSSAFAGFNQILVAMLKPTKEASDLAAQLGIDFSASALKSKGLAGVLADISAKGGDSAANMSTLFGSIEAFNVATTLVNQKGAKFNDFLGQMADSAGSVDKAFATMSETIEAKVARTLNKLNDSFVKLGQGVIIAVEPVIDMISFLADAFISLPAPIQQTIGVVTIFAGVALTLAGAIALVTAALATSRGGITAFVGAIGTAQIAMTSFAAYNGITAASLGLIAVKAALVIAAIGAAALAYDSLREKGTEFNDNSARMRTGIREITEELERQNNELAINDENQLKAIKARREWFDLFGGRQKQRNADIEINAYKVAEEANLAIDKIRELGNTQAEQEAKQKFYNLAVQELATTLEELGHREADLGTEKYEVLRANVLASKKALDQTAAAVGLTGDSAETAAPQVEKLTKATEDSTKAAEAESAAKAKAQAINSLETEIANKKEDAALSKEKEAQIKRITDATEAQTKAIQSQQETAIANLQSSREDQKTTQSTAYQDQIEAIKDQSESDRMARKAVLEQQLEQKKDAFELSRNTQKEQFEQRIENLKDLRSASRQKAEEALAEKISERLENQAASFSRASSLVSEQEKLAAAETEEEKARIAEQFAAQRRIEDRAAAMDLANKVISSSALVSMAKDLANVGTVTTVEDAQRIQFALAELEKQQKAQQAEADRVAQEALAERQRLLDRQSEEQIQTMQKAFEAEQNAAEKALQAELQAQQTAFDAQERALDLALREDLQSREAIFNEQQRLLDKQSALEIEAIKAASEQQIRAANESGQGQIAGINQSFDALAFQRSIEDRAKAAGLSDTDSQRLLSLTEASKQNTEKTALTSQQSLSALQGVGITNQSQLQTTQVLSDNARAFLQSQVSELQKLNTTNSSILESVRFVSAQINGLPSAIAASMPRPAPIPLTAR